MRVAHLSEVGRRFAVMSEIGRTLDGLERGQSFCRLPELSSPEITDAQRLDYIQGLVSAMRLPMLADGEMPTTFVYSLGAQVVAWLISLEERDEGRLP